MPVKDDINAYNRNYVRAKVEKGICRLCSNPAVKGKTFCVKCLEYRTKEAKQRRQDKIDRGICTYCSKPAVNGRAMCQEHLDKINQYSKRRTKNNAASRICKLCKNPVESGKTYCSEHLQYLREKAKEKRKSNRDQGLCYCGKEPKAEGYSRCEKCLKLHNKHTMKNLKKSQYGGNWWKALERDNHTCQICGATKEDDSRITVHHIDGMGENTDSPNHDLDNLGRLITCPYCLGAWIALPLAIYANMSLWWLWWLAIAGLQAFLQGLTGGR